ncbi:MAG: L28 family ribosomal protein [bacterium]|nr:L28 family ribosomal protein [bacterium]
MRKCAICGKGSIMAGKRKLLRGHYNLTKTERKYPNLQWVRLPVPARPARLPVGQAGGRLAGLPTGWPSHPAGLPAVGRFGGRRRVKACTECIRTLQKAKK